MFSYLDLGGSCVGIDICKTSLSCVHLRLVCTLIKKKKKIKNHQKLLLLYQLFPRSLYRFPTPPGPIQKAKSGN